MAATMQWPLIIFTGGTGAGKDTAAEGMASAAAAGLSFHRGAVMSPVKEAIVKGLG